VVTIDTNQLRSERNKLFQQCVKVDSFKELLEVQLAIADSIRQAERLLKGKRDTTLQFHIQRLRLYADGLVWLVLHPHVVRQLAKNANVPKSLLDQGEGFDLVLQSARNHFKKLRLPVFIADITNVIKLGDLIVVTNREAPMIVESKKRLPKPEHLMQGRIGRQVSRAMGTLKYLHEGSAKVYGDDYYRHTIETPYKAQRNWEIVDKVCANGLRDGWAESGVFEHEVMWAYTRGQEQKLQSKIRQWDKKNSVQFLGTSLGLMNMRDGFFPPPGIWPISPESRFALLEEDVVLVHLLDASVFEHTSETGESIRVDSERDFPVIVTTGGKEYPLSRRFIYDVLYGFETVESCIDGLFQFARQLHEQLPTELPKASETKSSIHYVTTIAQVMTLARETTQSEDDLVAIAPDLLAKLQGRRSIFKPKSLKASARRADWGSYAVTTMAELWRLLDQPLSES